MFRAQSRGPSRALRLLAVALPLLAAGCQQGQGAARQVTVAQFEGDLDLKAGTLTFRVARANSRIASVQDIPVVQDGQPGVGTPDTVELVTEVTSVSATDPITCGRAGSFCADVTLRSFYTATELHNVFVELTAMTPPTGGLGFASTAAPTGGQPGAGQVGNSFGLWAYPALLDTGASDAGANAATRRWYFNDVSSQSYHFVGRVMADLVVPAAEAIGALATCGVEPAVATSLATLTDCGECGRAVTGGASCSYAPGAVNVKGGTALGYGVTCTTAGQTACDTTSSTELTCVDLQADPANCGVCGNDCGDTSCNAGVCGVQCAGTDIACDPVCCPAGSTCTAGACILSDATELSVGTDHSCAITTSARLPTQLNAAGVAATYPNNVVCWGQNHLGQWGNPVWTEGRPVPEYFAGLPQFHLNTDMFSIAAGHFESAALTSIPGIAGRRWGMELPFSGFNPVAGWTTRAVKLTAGNGHGCGMFNYYGTQDPPTRGTSPEGIYCWGYNASGAIGKGDANLGDFCGTDGGDDLSCFPLSLSGKPWPTDLGAGGGLTATDIAAGGDTTCVVEAAPGCADGGGQCHGEDQTAGHVACWGDNTSGKAGAAAGAYLLAPAEVAGIAGAVEVSVGHEHAAARLAGGNLVLWGSNAHGQYGDGTTASTPGTVVTVSGTSATSVAAGNGFTCYADTLGDVYCAGLNDRGQLGDTTTTSHDAFVQVVGVADAVEVRAGGVPGPGGTADGTACARTSGGNVLCWGDNQQGQLGCGIDGVTLPYSSTPLLVQLASTSPVP